MFHTHTAVIGCFMEVLHLQAIKNRQLICEDGQAQKLSWLMQVTFITEDITAAVAYGNHWHNRGHNCSGLSGTRQRRKPFLFSFGYSYVLHCCCIKNVC
jgi:hypothetical protein